MTKMMRRPAHNVSPYISTTNNYFEKVSGIAIVWGCVLPIIHYNGGMNSRDGANLAENPKNNAAPYR